jgi:hypothetical protein
MTNMHRPAQSRTAAARRTALGLLAAVAVTLGGVAAPLAGTAHAGGAAGGVVGSRTSAAYVGAAGSPALAGGNGGDVNTAEGSKPGGSTDGAPAGSNPGTATIEPAGRIPGAAGTSGV